MSKNEIVTAKTTAVGSVLDFAMDAGLGAENADTASFALPFLQILQGLSPKIESVEGAKPGLFINTITDELFKECLVVPCYYQRRFLRWASRENGGGFRGDYSPADVEGGKIAGLVRDSYGRFTIEGDQVKDTREHYLLVQCANGEWQRALLSLSSTQIKKSKRWMSMIQMLEMRRADGKLFTPPSFSHIYRLRTVKEENNAGSWYGLDVSLEKPVDDAALYQKAKAFYESVKGGEVSAARETADDAAPSAAPAPAAKSADVPW